MGTSFDIDQAVVTEGLREVRRIVQGSTPSIDPEGATLTMSDPFTFERLTPRQREVIIRKAEGKTYGQVAYELGVTEQTVKNHLGLVYARLGAEHLIRPCASSAGCAAGQIPASERKPRLTARERARTSLATDRDIRFILGGTRPLPPLVGREHHTATSGLDARTAQYSGPPPLDAIGGLVPTPSCDSGALKDLCDNGDSSVTEGSAIQRGRPEPARRRRFAQKCTGYVDSRIVRLRLSSGARRVSR